MEKRVPLCTVGGNADLCSHCGNKYGVTSENENSYCLIIQQFYFWNIFKEIQNTDSKESMHPYEILKFSKKKKKNKLPLSSVDKKGINIANGSKTMPWGISLSKSSGKQLMP